MHKRKKTKNPYRWQAKKAGNSRGLLKINSETRYIEKYREKTEKNTENREDI